jgi:hypothetical protein
MIMSKRCIFDEISWKCASSLKKGSEAISLAEERLEGMLHSEMLLEDLMDISKEFLLL